VLVPILLLVLLPAGYFGARAGLFRHLRGAWGFAAAALVLVGLSLPATGLDYTHVKRMNLLIAAATATILALREAGTGWMGDRGRRLAALAALAALAVVTYLGFLTFHGQRTWVHYHDVAHYYLGSKYFDELRYGDLYTAMLRAEAEVYGDRFRTVEARDLRTGDIVPIRDLLRASDRVKAAFSPDRWIDFRADVALFRETLGSQYAGLFQDHGFNPTPAWAMVGGRAANLVPAGSRPGLLALSLLDPLLIAGAFAAVAWAFGLEAMLLAVIAFCVTFGANFGWTGGAFLRFIWFFGVVAGFAALEKRRFAAAGALFGLATALRIFPAFFALGLFFKAAADALAHGGVERGYRRFFAAMAAAVLALVGLSAAAHGLDSWTGFRENMAEHRTTVSPNMVGLTSLLAWRDGPALVTQEEFRAIRERRERIYRVQLATVFAAGLVAAAAVAPFLDDIAAAALGAPLLFLGLNLASYYYAFLVVLVLAHRQHPRRLALIFAAEAISHALLLFEEREAVLYLFRDLVLLYLFAALAVEQWRSRSARVKMEA
jgi:hypothetical protein